MSTASARRFLRCLLVIKYSSQSTRSGVERVACFSRTWKGTTPEDFDAQVRAWFTTLKQPKLGVPYIELAYKPMLELLDYLRANEFRVFVVSGGGREFMRVFAEETWGLFKENVIGTAAEYFYVDGKIVRGEHAIGGLNVRARLFSLNATTPTPGRDGRGNHGRLRDGRGPWCDGFCHDGCFRDGVADDAYASDTCWSEWHFSLLLRLGFRRPRWRR